jgi:hypothetical protein
MAGAPTTQRPEGKRPEFLVSVLIQAIKQRSDLALLYLFLKRNKKDKILLSSLSGFG